MRLQGCCYLRASPCLSPRHWIRVLRHQDFSSLVIFECEWWGFTLSQQVLYCLNHLSSPPLFIWCWDNIVTVTRSYRVKEASVLLFHEEQAKLSHAWTSWTMVTIQWVVTRTFWALTMPPNGTELFQQCQFGAALWFHSLRKKGLFSLSVRKLHCSFSLDSGISQAIASCP